jgi:hypothetical protein
MDQQKTEEPFQTDSFHMDMSSTRCFSRNECRERSSGCLVISSSEQGVPDRSVFVFMASLQEVAERAPKRALSELPMR